MNGRSQIQGGKNWIKPKEIKANRSQRGYGLGGNCLSEHIINLVWKIERKQPSLLAILTLIYFIRMTPCYKGVAIRKTILFPPYKKQTVLILIVLLKNLYIFLLLFQLVFPCVFFPGAAAVPGPARSIFLKLQNSLLQSSLLQTTHFNQACLPVL